jgi:glycosyltransferase involved in cell wall biosynthesis
LGKIFRKKILIKMTMPGADDPESVRRLMGRAAFYFFQQADAFILASPVFNSRLLPEKKLYRIPNGVDTQKFRPLDSRAECNRVKNLLGLPEEKKNILFVGYFSPLKGVDLLLEAWQLIRSRYKDTARIILISSQGQCSFYVDAGFKKELEEKISSWVIGEEIILVDKTLEISDYYKAADIFVLPSRIEGMPNALLEGMASSLPSLSSDIPAVTKIICDRENGMLFESGKSADLAEKIKILLDDPGYAESLGKKARESVLENFSLEKVARQYAELYRKIAAA